MPKILARQTVAQIGPDADPFSDDVFPFLSFEFNGVWEREEADIVSRVMLQHIPKYVFARFSNWQLLCVRDGINKIYNAKEITRYDSYTVSRNLKEFCKRLDRLLSKSHHNAKGETK